MQPDYLIVGSGLAGLSFGALMAHAGKRVRVLEAHHLPGGYGHTFVLGRLFPRHAGPLARFVDEVRRTAAELEALPDPLRGLPLALRLHRFTRVLRYRRATLQQVFDRFEPAHNVRASS